MRLDLRQPDSRILLACLSGMVAGVLMTLAAVYFAKLDSYGWGRVLVLLALCGLLTVILFAQAWAFRQSGSKERGSSEAAPEVSDSEVTPSRPSVPNRSSYREKSEAALPQSKLLPIVRTQDWEEKQAPATRAEVPGASPSTRLEAHGGVTGTAHNWVGREAIGGSGVEVPISTYSSTSVERLVEVWHEYFQNGDGSFNSHGLKRRLEAAGLHSRVLPGDELGAGDALLAVESGDGSGRLFLLPSFKRTPRSVSEWFHYNDAVSRVAKIQRLVKPGVGRKTNRGLVIEQKGAVE